MVLEFCAALSIPSCESAQWGGIVGGINATRVIIADEVRWTIIEH